MRDLAWGMILLIGLALGFGIPALMMSPIVELVIWLKWILGVIGFVIGMVAFVSGIAVLSHPRS